VQNNSTKRARDASPLAEARRVHVKGGTSPGVIFAKARALKGPDFTICRLVIVLQIQKAISRSVRLNEGVTQAQARNGELQVESLIAWRFRLNSLQMHTL
jgi:hypothetical protein